jgi:MerR family transcriptional regulator, aldehyde-responsive regulator
LSWSGQYIASVAVSHARDPKKFSRDRWAATPDLVPLLDLKRFNFGIVAPMATTAVVLHRKVHSPALTIQQLARHTGLAESALRYYERIGLIDPVPRDQSSGHRRYPPALVSAVESLSCLRGAGMRVADMRTYVDNMRRGDAAASDQRELFTRHAQRLGEEIAEMERRRCYVAAKAELWAARERGDTETEARVTGELIEIAKGFFDDFQPPAL